MSSNPRVVFPLLFVALLLMVPALAYQMIPLDESLESKGFEHLETRDGVRVYKHPTKQVIRVAAEGYFPYPIDVVKNTLIDYRAQQGKVGRVSEVRIVQQKKNLILVYQRLNLPVISDRDFNLEVRWGGDDRYTWIQYVAVKEGVEPRKKVVRVNKHKGSWQLRAKGQNRTFARFEVVIDLGGSLPMWLARSGSADELPQLYMELGQIMKTRR